jgi:prostaglandin-endoperoxide synthase 2
MIPPESSPLSNFRGALKGSFGGMLTDAEVELRLDKMYATGLERGNSSVGYVALSLVFLREHNRICDELFRQNPSWQDEQLFQTARMINICLLLKLTVEDYINHIAGQRIFRLDPSFAEQQNWYRTNWIALEFDLLYRWHGLVPDSLIVNKATVR